jgi:hypothetical protein
MRSNIASKPASLPDSLLRVVVVFASSTTLWTTAPTARGQDIFVTNYGSGTIGEYTTSGATVNASLVSGLYNPLGVAVSGSTLYVANYGAGQSLTATGSIGEYTTSGTTVNASLISGLIPVSVTASGSDLLVGNYLSVGGFGPPQFVGNLGEYTTSGSTVNASLLEAGSPPNIAVSGSDVYEILGSKVGEYTTSGATVNASLITGLNSGNVPDDIAVSGSDIFVSYFGTGTIAEYTTSGDLVNASLITGLDEPTDFAVSGSDLFIANSGSGTIGEYTTSGATVNATLISGLDDPYGITVSESVPSVPDACSTCGLMFLSISGLALLRRRFTG